MYLQTQEVQQIPSRINAETHTETLYTNYQKPKRALKAVREKQLVTYEGILNRHNSQFYIKNYGGQKA